MKINKQKKHYYEKVPDIKTPICIRCHCYKLGCMSNKNQYCYVPFLGTSLPPIVAKNWVYVGVVENFFDVLHFFSNVICQKGRTSLFVYGQGIIHRL